MNSTQTHVRLFSAGPASTQGFRTAVSLHCHTQHSHENLSFIPHYASRIPIVAKRFQSELERHRKRGKNVDFSSLYWTPPVSAQGVLESEVEQIERQVGLEALVSITDHDSIEAGQLLQVVDPSSNIPVSVEWTVPFGDGFFHLGVHNLPPEQSSQIMTELSDYTFSPGKGRLRDLFAMLNELPEVLLVLNHPHWDIEFAGDAQHARSLSAFITEYGKCIHALEVNGYRSRRENKVVLRTADELGLPVVSGGDRHACGPNTVLNLTAAGTFAEFVSQVRYDRISEILLMPVYCSQRLAARQMEGGADFLRFCPQYPCGQQRWTDRVFVYTDERGAQPLSLYAPNYWREGGPPWLRHTLRVVSLLGSRRFRPAMRLAWLLLAPDEELVVLLQQTAGKHTDLDLKAPTTINKKQLAGVMGTVANMPLERLPEDDAD
ncbi:MAG: hypothetical protein ABI923_08555 [bacterium]